MKRLFATFFILLDFACASAQTASPFAPDRLIVQFNQPVHFFPGDNYALADLEGLNAINQAYLVQDAVDLFPAFSTVSPGYQHLPHHQTYVLEFANPVDIPAAVSAFSSLPGVALAEPDYYCSITSGTEVTYTPNDALYSRQWSLSNDGTFPYSTSTVDADIDMDLAWDITTGDSTVILAILDTGIKTDHPEFSGRLWRNPLDSTINGLNEDGNFYVDDFQGWNFSYNSPDVTDDHRHGTVVSGLAAATGDNGIGYAGIDWHCRILPVKVLDSLGSGTFSKIVSGINYASQMGADVINMSLGGGASSATLQTAINNATANGVVVVAAMGNDNHGLKSYPAAMNNVIAVGSTNPDDRRSRPFEGWYYYGDTLYGSNWGAHNDVMAPGNFVWVLDNASDTAYTTYAGGTSYATPHVSGVCALLRAIDSTFSPADITAIITSTAEDTVGSPDEDSLGFDFHFGYGRLNAYNALSYGLVYRDAPVSPVWDVALYPNPAAEKISISFSLAASAPVSLLLTDPGGRTISSTQCGTLTPGNHRMQQALPSVPGFYFLTVAAGASRVVKKIVVQ